MTTREGSAAPLSPLKDQGDRGPSTELMREEQTFALDSISNRKLYVGDRLDLEFSGYGTLWVSRSGHPLGRVFELDHRDFPKDRDLDTWTAVVSGVDAEGSLYGRVTHVRLIPFHIASCGCVRNLGGYAVRRCEPHEREIDELLGDKHAYEGFGTKGWDDDPRREQEAIHRETSQ